MCAAREKIQEKANRLNRRTMRALLSCHRAVVLAASPPVRSPYCGSDTMTSTKDACRAHRGASWSERATTTGAAGVSSAIGRTRRDGGSGCRPNAHGSTVEPQNGRRRNARRRAAPHANPAAVAVQWAVRRTAMSRRAGEQPGDIGPRFGGQSAAGLQGARHNGRGLHYRPPASPESYHSDRTSRADRLCPRGCCRVDHRGRSQGHSAARRPAQVSGMTCIRPIAPADEMARHRRRFRRV